MGEIQQEYYLKEGKEMLQHCQLLKTLFIQFKNGNKLFLMMPNSGLIHSKHAIKTSRIISWKNLFDLQNWNSVSFHGLTDHIPFHLEKPNTNNTLD